MQHQRVDRIVFYSLLVLFISPLFVLHYFPTQDGPSHIANATILLQYNRVAIFREYFTLHLVPNPNWLGHIILTALIAIFPPHIAEKMLIATIIAVTAIAARISIRRVAPQNTFVAVLIFPLLYGYPLHMGFYNYCIGTALSLVTIAVSLSSERVEQSRQHLRDAGIAGLLVAVYFAHMLPWVVTAVLLMLTAAFDRQRRRLGLVLAIVPSALIAAYYVATSPGATAVSDLPEIGKRAKYLWELSSVQVFPQSDRWFIPALYALLLVLLLRKVIDRIRHGRNGDVWGVAFGGLLLIYMITPEGLSGGYYVSPRVQWFAIFTLIAWSATTQFANIEKHLLRVMCLALALIVFAVRVPMLKEVDRQLQEYVSFGDNIKPESTLLSIPFTQRPYTRDGQLVSDRVSFLLHADGYVAAERSLVTFDNYEANASYFPVGYRQELNPYRWIGIETDRDTPPKLEFVDYDQRTPGRVDYVIVWRQFATQRISPVARSTEQQLEERYALVRQSVPNGYARLYVRVR